MIFLKSFEREKGISAFSNNGERAQERRGEDGAKKSSTHPLEYWNLGKTIGHYGFTKGKP
jgi:hypothetical protein